MNSKQRRTYRRFCLRTVEAEARKECIRLGLDPDNWREYCLRQTPAMEKPLDFVYNGYRAGVSRLTRV